jgi:hypothetical protein
MRAIIAEGEREAAAFAAKPGLFIGIYSPEL